MEGPAAVIYHEDSEAECWISHISTSLLVLQSEVAICR